MCLAGMTAAPASAQVVGAPSSPSPSPEPTTAAATPSPASRVYPIIRADQNWGFLANPANRTDPFDSLEYIPLGSAPKDWYVSIGGEIREVNESIGNDLWGKAPYENSYLLQRYLFISDFHLGPRLRAFFELKSNTENGRIGGPRPIDDASLDFLGAFVEAGLGPSPSSPTLRLGREELSLGSGRLIAPREGPNVRQSFTGGRAWADVGAFHIDALDVHPDEDSAQAFADVPTQATSLWGLYASTKPTGQRAEFDAYYLGLQRQSYAIARGTDPETRQTLGLRLTRPFSLGRSGFDFDDELVYQVGTFGPHPILAWSVATATGWHFGPSPRSPHLLMKADISSGDDPKRNTVGTFDPYFPIGGYFGILATTGPGPVNFVDAHPAVSSTFGPITVTADWLWYWRQNVNDGLYAIPGTLLRLPSGSTARFVGQRPGIELKWQIDRHLYVQGEYGVFTAGPFIQESGPALPILYRALWVGYKF
jgi:Alginate export